MSTGRKTVGEYRTQALDLTTANELSKEELLKVLVAASDQGGLEVPMFNAILREQYATHQQVIQAAIVDSIEPKKELSPEQLDKLLRTLEARFKAHPYRHENITWEQVTARLANAAPEKLWSLNEMERTGGEPDVVARNPETGEIKFEDRSAESPLGRRKCTYDKAAEEVAKNIGYKTDGNAVDMAAAMGLEMLDKKEYNSAQTVDKLDSKTTSWVKTTIGKRSKGIALFGGRHNDEFGVHGTSNPEYSLDSQAFRCKLMV